MFLFCYIANNLWLYVALCCFLIYVVGLRVVELLYLFVLHLCFGVLDLIPANSGVFNFIYIFNFKLCY